MIANRLAPAKINLGLEIVGKREDGHHDIATVMQAIDLCDKVTLAVNEPLPGHLQPMTVPSDLVSRAVAAFSDRTGIAPPLVALEKAIPAAAGLGGGSSDAGTALLLANEFTGAGLSDEELVKLAFMLGSDVPFFLRGGAALAEGRGDQLTPLRALTGVTIVVVVPPIQIPEKTSTLYRSADRASFTSGDRAHAVAACLQGGQIPPPHLLDNVFWEPFLVLRPEIGRAPAELLSLGAPFVALSGAGPALYTWFESRTDAEGLCSEVAAALPASQCFLASPHPS